MHCKFREEERNRPAVEVGGSNGGRASRIRARGGGRGGGWDPRARFSSSSLYICRVEAVPLLPKPRKSLSPFATRLTLSLSLAIPQSVTRKKKMVSALLRIILVTGGAGYIGSHTVLQLLQQGLRVVVADNLDNASQIALVRVAELAGHNGANLVFHEVLGAASSSSRFIYRREEIFSFTPGRILLLLNNNGLPSPPPETGNSILLDWRRIKFV
jgi:hypothetical protein